MTSNFGKGLSHFEHLWKNIRIFAFRNRTVFELVFILVYFGEQFLLVILTYIWPNYIKLLVTLFALIVLTTFAIHKLVMESRIKILEYKLGELSLYTESIENEAKNLSERYNEVVESYNTLIERTQSLNNLKKA